MLIYDRLVRWVFRCALAGAAYTASVFGWLLFTADEPVPTPLWVLAYIGVFPVGAAAVLKARMLWSRRMSSAAVEASTALRHPARAVISIIAVIAVLALVALIATALGPGTDAPPGQPEIVDGRYVLNNHGDITAISRVEYLHYTEAGQRGFLAGALIFYLVAALIVAMTVDRLQPLAIERRGARGAREVA